MTAEVRERRSFIGFLSPVERTSEVLFGLIMVMTFTGSVAVAAGGREEVREILWAALGCNLAWGIVDAAMYLMAALTQQARGSAMIQAVRRTHEAADAHRLISAALPQGLSELLDEREFEALRRRLTEMPEPPGARLTRDDFMAALGVLLLVFLSTFPVVLPFLVVKNTRWALHLSHAVALTMLFGAGWLLGKHAGRAGWQIGAAMVILGLLLATLTLVLGG